MTRAPLRVLFPVLLLAVASAAQHGGTPDATPLPFRLHVIGASVSGGFRDGPLTGATEPGDSVTLQHVLKAWCGEQARATTHAPLEMLAMFTNPETIGKKQVEAALKAKPDAVLALDFPFWFAYGHVPGDDESAARRERFAKGLELLARFDVPVLVGDLPDMTGAARRMLAPAQIPSPGVLRELNADLAAFVAEHPNVRLVELAAIVKTMKEEGVALPLAEGAVPTPPGALLQGDRLHANRLGMAFLGFTLQPVLRQLFPEGHPLRAQAWQLEEFIAACGAESELAAIRGKTAAPGASGRQH